MPANPLVQWFGPFLIPAVLFVLGIVGYIVLSFLSSRDLLSRWE